VNAKFNYEKYFQILPNGKDTAVAPSKGWFEVAMTMNPKPKTVALLAADAEYAQNVIGGARRVVKEMGLKTVYDAKYDPKTVDYLPIVRALAASNADIIYVASYPADSVGIIKAAHEVGLKTQLFGGGMIGLAFAPIKVALGPLLNGITVYDVYVPEPTMKFPGIEAFLKRYQELAGKGEWEKGRVLFVQYQGIDGSGIEQFKQAGKQVILYPPEFVSGKLQTPYVAVKK